MARTKYHGMTMDERQQHRLESRVRTMGTVSRKLKRAMSAQTELMHEVGAVGVYLAPEPPVYLVPEQPVPKKEAPAKAPPVALVTEPPGEYPDPLVLIAQLVDILLNTPALYDKADAAVHSLDIALGDLNHAVELCDLPKKDEHRIMQDIKKNRVERRKAKDFVRKAKPLYEYIAHKPWILTELLSVQKELVRVNETFGRRTYTPRIRTDLRELFIASNVSLTSEGGE